MDAAKADGCRVCGSALYNKPLLQLQNMPSMAQNFPDRNALATDRGEDLEIFQCSSCGLVQLNCTPVPYYKEVIRAAAYSAEMREFRLDQFAGFITEHNLSGKRVLEVGAGKGEYLQLMQAQGVEAFGLEYTDNPGQNIISGYIDSIDYQISTTPFDAFFCLNFLEHMPDPVVSLQGICNNLTPGAIGLVEVPNFDMIIEKNLFSEFIRDHLFYFTARTLRTLLECSGFEVISCEPVWHDYSLSAVVRKRAPTDLSTLIAFKQRIAEDVYQFVDQFCCDNVAIWGAGHQALAVINLLELHDKATLVVDSAPFKQGRFTPGSHLPIHPPEILNHRPIDAVIVMAASYSDEVAQIIRDNYPASIRVAVLRDYGLEEV